MRDAFGGSATGIWIGSVATAGLAAFGLVAALAPPVPRAHAAETGPGLEVAATCVACHRAEGRSDGIVPIIGLPAATLSAALRDFRAGKRPGMIMQVVAKSLSDDEIAKIADSLAALNTAETRP